MPILGDRVYQELEQERIICITGRLSGGKTRLGFELALPWWKRGYRINSNSAHNFINWTGVFTYDLYRSFNIVDEGGEYVRQEKMASMITRSAAKSDYFVVFAGKRLPHKALQQVIIKPRFDFYFNYGIPLILWKAKVSGGDEPYKFSFFQVYPQYTHGTFSTRTSSAGIEEILARAEKTVDRLAREEGQTAGRQLDAGWEGLADDLAGGLSDISSKDLQG